MEIVTKGAEQSSALPVPVPRVPITIRLATNEDIPFMDALQKLHSKQVGWMSTKQFEGKIGDGHVLVAEEVGSSELVEGSEGSGSALPTANSQLRTSVGYCIATDRYMKREDVGILYQMNVAPGHQRGFVGAALLKAQFERSAYGCRLYCCWCAQDIEANRFWEAMGFTPLAYRAGSEKKGRVHIFWQKRIREGDSGQGATPWWFPSQTKGGSMADRLVFPIPPGTHWSDAKPVILPQKQLPVASCQVPVKDKGQRAKDKGPAAPKRGPLSGGLCFASVATGAAMVVADDAPKPKTKRVKPKNDPKLVAAARELRDRWLEHVNAGEMRIEGAGKYDLTRALPDLISPAPLPPLLPALPPLSPLSPLSAAA